MLLRIASAVVRCRVWLAALVLLPSVAGCGRQAVVAADGLPLRRVVIYRNGVAYFQREGHVEEDQVRFRIKESEVGDFLATLAVMERGGSSVQAAAFPLDLGADEPKPTPPPTTPRPPGAEKRGMKRVLLTLDGKAHDLQIGYVAPSPVWRPSYRLVVRAKGEADLQAWGIVQNVSGEDWTRVSLSLVAGAPLAFTANLATSVIPERPTVTDNGEVILAVPKSETSLSQETPAPEPTPGAPPVAPTVGAADDAMGASAQGGAARGRGPRSVAKKADANAADKASPMMRQEAAAAPAPPPAPPRDSISAPRNVRSLAAIAVEAGTTRYDLPMPVTVPDNSATMVLLLAKRVPGEAIYLFAPDGGVPDSHSHPFRVARFANRTGGVLERGPIAVFEEGAFLGQGLVDPLPDGATATVPFALERALAVEQERKHDELGERIAKIENGELTVERDGVTQTKYRFRNGTDRPAKLLVKHPRTYGTRLYMPPAGTEDNTGTQTALVPGLVGPRATVVLTVDERATLRRAQDWFSPVTDNAVKAYLADPRADGSTATKLAAAWALRADIVRRQDAAARLAQEQAELSRASEETRRNLQAIEKNKAAVALRAKLTARLADLSARLDEVTKRIVDGDAKLSELQVGFREAVRDITLRETPPPKP